MTEAIIVAIITGGLALLGTIYSSNKTTRQERQTGQAASGYGNEAGRPHP